MFVTCTVVSMRMPMNLDELWIGSDVAFCADYRQADSHLFRSGFALCQND